MSHYPHFHTHHSVIVTIFVDDDMKDLGCCLYTLFTTHVNCTIVIIVLIVTRNDHHLYCLYLDICSCCFVSL